MIRVTERELEEARVFVAHGQMRLARRQPDGELIIGGTTRGTVALRYDRQRRTYSITTQDGGSWRVAGKAGFIGGELGRLYDPQPPEGYEIVKN